MALSAQNQNVIVALMNWGAAMLELRDDARLIAARWNNNDVFNALTDEDVQAVFPHLTKSEVSNAITALNVVLGALGDDVSGQAVNLIKLEG